MESAIDQAYDKFESQFSDEVWWKEAKERGLGFKVSKGATIRLNKLPPIRPLTT